MNKVLVVAGPTAVGKTEYTIALAKKLDGEIVSCDSMQLYKYMDIGSAKPTNEELMECKHYLVGEIDPRENFSVSQYQQLASKAIDHIITQGKLPIVEGGTGLYLNSMLYDMDFSEAKSNNSLRRELGSLAAEKGNDALYEKLKELDENAAKEIHPNNVKKVIRAIERIQEGQGVRPFSKCIKPNSKYDFKLICITRNRDELYDRINQRVDLLFEKGLVDEVKELLNIGLTQDNISMKGIGYKEVIGYLNGQYDLDEAKELVKKNTRHFAKRQITWFKRYDKMKWFNLSDYNSKDQAIETILKYIQEG